jgi:hypothetical protein
VTERFQSLASYGGNTSFLEVDTREHVRGLYGWMLRNSRASQVAVRWLQQSAREGEAARVIDLAKPELEAWQIEAWDDTLAEIDRIRVKCEDLDIPFLLVVMPYRFELGDPTGTRQPQDRLIRWAWQHDVEFVDLLPELASARVRAGEVFRDRNHLTLHGHTLVAGLLAEPFEDLMRRDGAS